jgi:hypothetical protein
VLHVLKLTAVGRAVIGRKIDPESTEGLSHKSPEIHLRRPRIDLSDDGERSLAA